jgi:hypothetical protein
VLLVIRQIMNPLITKNVSTPKNPVTSKMEIEELGTRHLSHLDNGEKDDKKAQKMRLRTATPEYF